MTNMITVTGLHAHYGEIHALKGIDFHVEEGEVVTILGANGAGKSTTIKSIMGLHRPSAGTVLFQGREIAGKPASFVSRGGIGLAPEGRHVFANLTVKENLLLGAYARKSRAEVAADLEIWFETFPRLRERLGQKAGTLSGGEQQMVAISRAMMGRPRMLLLDEPSLGMAPLVIQSMATAISSIAASGGMSVLLVEQNVKLALQLASRGYVLALGRVAYEGTRDQLESSEEVQKAYLGEGHHE